MPWFGGIGGATRGGAQRGDLQGMVLRNFRVSIASAVAIAEWQNSFGEALILTAMWANFFPGAGQNFTQLMLAIDDFSGQGTNLNILKSIEVAGAANVIGELDWSGATIVPPGFWIKATGSFNAAGANNITRMALHAYLPERTPRRLL